MLIVSCIDKIRDSALRILWYLIVDEKTQKTRYVKPEQLKQAIRDGKVACRNLRLTQGNRLVDCEDTDDQNKLMKLKMLGVHNFNNFELSKDYKKVLKYNGKNGYVSIPSFIEEIGDRCFEDNTYIREVFIPDSVKKIGLRAFKCSLIQIVKGAKNVSEIGEEAFYLSTLEKFTIPKGVTVIPERCFKSCDFYTNIVIPDSVEVIKLSAFSGTIGQEFQQKSVKKRKKAKIVFGKGLKLIETSCFFGKPIASVKFNSKPEIRVGAFSYTDALDMVCDELKISPNQFTI